MKALHVLFYILRVLYCTYFTPGILSKLNLLPFHTSGELDQLIPGGMWASCEQRELSLYVSSKIMVVTLHVTWQGHGMTKSVTL